jgi:hypothetical protein
MQNPPRNPPFPPSKSSSRHHLRLITGQLLEGLDESSDLRLLQIKAWANAVDAMTCLADEVERDRDVARKEHERDWRNRKLVLVAACVALAVNAALTCVSLYQVGATLDVLRDSQGRPSHQRAPR